MAIVVGRIKQLFEDGNLGVGDPLPSERELCQICAASRTTVREAMRILKAYGVVEVRPKTGAVVIDRRMDAAFELFSFSTLQLSKRTFAETQGFRLLVEVGAFDMLIERTTAADIAELRAINESLRECAADPHAASGEDFRFHAKLVGIVGNRQLDELYRITRPVMLRIMQSGAERGRSAANYAEHEGIVDALERRDRLAFQYRVAAHLNAAQGLFEDKP